MTINEFDTLFEERFGQAPSAINRQARCAKRGKLHEENRAKAKARKREQKAKRT